MTVSEVMELTGQKRGTVEQFRSELQKFQLIANNQSLDDRAVETFKKAIKYKEANEQTWIHSMYNAIMDEYGEEMNLPFYWTKDILLKSLIWQVKNNEVRVQKVDEINDQKDFHIIYDIMIENFKELGKVVDVYKNSFGTDGNATLTYKCLGEDHIYYIIGKYNNITGEEDIHVFYNDHTKFNINKCTHICGGSSKKGRLKELKEICRHLTLSK